MEIPPPCIFLGLAGGDGFGGVIGGLAGSGGGPFLRIAGTLLGSPLLPVGLGIGRILGHPLRYALGVGNVGSLGGLLAAGLTVGLHRGLLGLGLLLLGGLLRCYGGNAGHGLRLLIFREAGAGGGGFAGGVPRPGLLEAHPSLGLHGGKRGRGSGGGYRWHGQRLHLGEAAIGGLLAMAADGLDLPERGGILRTVAPSAVAGAGLTVSHLLGLMDQPSVESGHQIARCLPRCEFRERKGSIEGGEPCAAGYH